MTDLGFKFALSIALATASVSASSNYDDKAAVINAKLLGCTVSSDAMDECIDDWSDRFSSYDRPDASSMSDKERAAFSENIQAVISLNSNTNLTWVANLNAFSLWDLKTFTSYYLAGDLTLPSADSVNYRIERRAITLPSAVDWSSIDLNGTTLSNVRDQGKLGVSWYLPPSYINMQGFRSSRGFRSCSSYLIERCKQIGAFSKIYHSRNRSLLQKAL